MEILDIDLESIAELQKYIKMTDINSLGDVDLTTRELEHNPDIEETDHLFWNLVDTYADIVIYLDIKTQVDQMSNFFITLTSQLDALEATVRGIEDS
jgi:hypothetical protein